MRSTHTGGEHFKCEVINGLIHVEHHKGEVISLFVDNGKILKSDIDCPLQNIR